jgi:transcriptional regulator GlxA family with amidase domain
MKTRLAAVVMSMALAFPVFAHQSKGANDTRPTAAVGRSRIAPPARGERLRVAFVVTEGAVVIDFTGPWEVFQDVMIPSRGPNMEDEHPFDLYTVSDTRAPIRVSDGMRIVPDYTFDDAPAPKIVVVPAQSGRSPQMLAWIRKMTGQSDVVMSVCTGAFVLAEAGLLNGKSATTHHQALDRLHQQFPQIAVQRHVRYVQSDPVIFTAGGLSSGIDLALHIVDLYFGRPAAEATAQFMEYEGKGWLLKN